jgi:hypothetical protein
LDAADRRIDEGTETGLLFTLRSVHIELHQTEGIDDLTGAAVNAATRR